MKLIIDTEVIKDLLETEWGYKGLMDDLDDLFAKNGIPLDKLRDEIEAQIAYNGFFNDGVKRALQIIDKYKGEHDEQYNNSTADY